MGWNHQPRLYHIWDPFFFLKQLIGTWPESQCTMQRYVHKIIPYQYVHIMYMHLQKYISLCITCIHLYLEMYPYKKASELTQNRVPRGRWTGTISAPGQRYSTMFDALLGESSWTNSESHAIDSWKRDSNFFEYRNHQDWWVVWGDGGLGFLGSPFLGP